MEQSHKDKQSYVLSKTYTGYLKQVIQKMQKNNEHYMQRTTDHGHVQCAQHTICVPRDFINNLGLFKQLIQKYINTCNVENIGCNSLENLKLKYLSVYCFWKNS